MGGAGKREKMGSRVSSPPRDASEAVVRRLAAARRWPKVRAATAAAKSAEARVRVRGGCGLGDKARGVRRLK
jgi:hypothetical protein